MTENLETEVHEETRKRGNGWKGFLFGLATGAIIGTGMGVKQELKKHTMYEHHIKQEIKEGALDGYAWKEGADPKFYHYEQPVLVKDSANMTMQGYMVKLTPTDTIIAGPIRKDGKIGYPLHNEIKKEVGEDIKGLKEKFGKFGEDVKEGYQKTDNAVREQFNKWFNKDRSEVDTTYVQ